MLTSIRENISGWIAWLIVILISIPFALWGVNSYFEAQSTVVVAEGDGVKVTDRQLKEAVDRQAEILRSQYGPQLAAKMVDSPEYKKQILESLVEQQLLRRDVADNGFRLSDAQLKLAIQHTPDFQVNGQFSSERYSRLLASSRRSPAQYEDSIRITQSMQQVASGFAGSSMVISSRLDQLLALKGQERDVQYVVLSPTMFEGTVEVSEAQMREHYETNKERYRSPEMVSVNYVVLSVPELAKSIQPGEEKLKENYEENRDQYRTEEQRKASHILIAASGEDEGVWKKAQEKASHLAEKARQGADFATLAKENSADPGSAKKGGDLGFFGHGVMTPEFEKKVFSMQKGDISDPVKTPFGYHVIKLVDLRPEVVKPFEEVREKVLDAVRKQEAENQFYEQAETLNNIVYEQPDSLEPAAEALNTKVQVSDMFSRTGSKGIFSNPKVIDAAFSEQVLSDGVNSDTIEVDSETLVALRLNKRQESAIKPFDEVKAQIRQELVAKTARDMAREKADGFVRSLRDGDSWSKLVQEYGLDVKQETIARDKDLGFGGELTRRIFQMPTPADGKASVENIDLGDRGFAVAKLNKTVDGNPEKAKEADKTQVETALKSRFGNEFFNAYKKALRKRSDVELKMSE